MPDEFAGGIGVFDLKGIGKVNFTEACSQVFFMEETGAFDLTPEVGNDGIGQRGEAVFFTLAIADGDGLVFEVNIFDAQADTFHQAQAGAVEQLGHEFVRPGELVKEMEYFFVGQNRREAFGAFGAGEQDGFDLFVEDFAVEKENGAEGLTSTSSVHGFWVEAATLRWMARWVRKALISAAPMSLGWRLL